MAEKNKGGRPRVTDPKNRPLKFMLTADEEKLVHEAAAAANLAASAWAREKTLAAAKRQG